eukprot:6545792-Pyramimonas_sp.AAC.1
MGDDDEDGELVYTDRGLPEVEWPQLMRRDASLGFGDAAGHAQRLNDLAADLYKGVEAELLPLFDTGGQPA